MIDTYLNYTVYLRRFRSFTSLSVLIDQNLNEKIPINPLSDGNIFELTKLKAFADDKLNVFQNDALSVFDRVENTVEKGEKGCRVLPGPLWRGGAICFQ